MYFFYFDESGSRDPRAKRMLPDGTEQALDHLYVLTAVSLYEFKWRRFDQAIANLKLELRDHLYKTKSLDFDLADCEIKSAWLRVPKQREKESPFLHALTKRAMRMTDWTRKLDAFLTVNDRDLLPGLGKVSALLAQELAAREWQKFRQKQLTAGPDVVPVDKNFEEHVRRLKKAERIVPPKEEEK